MKHLIFIFILILMTSCGKKIQYETSVYIHEDVAPFVSRFQQLSGIQINDLHVTFKQMDMGLGGYCEKNEIIKETPFEKTITKTPKVFLNIDYWNNYLKIDKRGKELLVFHELGHCLLNRDHNESKLDFNGKSIPASIMTPQMFESIYYSSNYSHFIGELFNNYEQYASSSFSDNTYAFKINQNLNEKILNQIKEDEQSYTDSTEVKDCIMEHPPVIEE